METRSEIRILAHVGIAYVTHTFVPEVFLAKELQMCYAAILYVVNYAETGSRHRPFASGGLFGGLTEIDEAQRLARALGSMGAVVDKMAQAAGADSRRCGCDQPMAGQIDAYDLSSDWRTWFANGSDGRGAQPGISRASLEAQELNRHPPAGDHGPGDNVGVSLEEA